MFIVVDLVAAGLREVSRDALIRRTPTSLVLFVEFVLRSASSELGWNKEAEQRRRGAVLVSSSYAMLP